jgi:hypothetical protein
MRWLLLCLAIAGCARAGKENTIIGGLTDARMDTAVTLTQTVSSAITADNSLGCADMTTGITRQTSYYRVFTLADYAITTTLHVTQVEFGIQTAAAGKGAVGQPATINIGTYAGTAGGTTLDLAQVRMINSASIQISNGTATTMTVPITADIAPATSVIVELAIPDGTTGSNEFFVGTNTDAERAPGYLSSPDPRCGATQPTSMQSIADDNMLKTVPHMVMTVSGTTETPS